MRMPFPNEPCDVGQLLGQIRLRAGPIAADVDNLYMELPPQEGDEAAPAVARFHPLDQCHRVISNGDRLIAAPARNVMSEGYGTEEWR